MHNFFKQITFFFRGIGRRANQPLRFDIVQKLYKNRLQRFSSCGSIIEEGKITEEEIVLGSKAKVHSLGLRYEQNENDEAFLEDALTYLFVHRKLPTKSEYSFEEVVVIVKDAMAERNNFLRECMKQSRGRDEIKQIMNDIGGEMIPEEDIINI